MEEKVLAEAVAARSAATAAASVAAELTALVEKDMQSKTLPQGVENTDLIRAGASPRCVYLLCFATLPVSMLW